MGLSIDSHHTEENGAEIKADTKSQNYDRKEEKTLFFKFLNFRLCPSIYL